MEEAKKEEGQVAEVEAKPAEFVRTADEVQKVHDTLVSILLGECPNPMPTNQKVILSSLESICCWLLGHEHNNKFEKFMDDIYAFLKDQGYKIVDHGAPVVPVQPRSVLVVPERMGRN